MAVEFLSSGDTGLTVQFGYDIDRDLSRKIMALRAAVDDAHMVGVIETVPTYRSLLIHYNPLDTCQADLIGAVEPLIGQLDADGDSRSKCWVLPFCSAEEFAPDLPNVAQYAQMSESDVIDHITAIKHFVYMLGFAPGLPYMGDLPERLAIPRRKTPIKHVEKGSVLTATGMTLIYPAVNPTGWHIIGRCPVPIFDLAKDDPVLLSPGDYVQFQSVGKTEFDEIKEQVNSGLYLTAEGDC